MVAHSKEITPHLSSEHSHNRETKPKCDVWLMNVGCSPPELKLEIMWMFSCGNSAGRTNSPHWWLYILFKIDFIFLEQFYFHRKIAWEVWRISTHAQPPSPPSSRPGRYICYNRCTSIEVPLLPKVHRLQEGSLLVFYSIWILTNLSLHRHIIIVPCSAVYCPKHPLCPTYVPCPPPELVASPWFGLLQNAMSLELQSVEPFQIGVFHGCVASDLIFMWQQCHNLILYRDNRKFIPSVLWA